MTARCLIVGLFLTALVAAQLDGILADYEEPGVKQLVETDANGNDTVILVSFLAAISQVSPGLGALLHSLSQKSSSNSNSGATSAALEASSPHISNVGSLHKCFRMDFDGSMIAGALKVAIDDINEDDKLLPKHTLEYVFKNTCGDEKTSTKAFMAHWKMGARVFIGPESNCRTEAQMAAAQNLPIISYKCRDKVVSDKKKYSTFARTVPAETDITKAFLTTMKEFQWYKFSVIYESTTPASGELMEALKEAVENENKNAFDGDGNRFTIQNQSEIHAFSDILGSSIVDQVIEQTKDITRIYVTFGSVQLFRRILQTMGQKGLMDNQEYLLIYLDPDYNWLDVYHAMNNHFVRNTMVDLVSSWDMTNTSDRKTAEYLRNALAIIPTPVDYTSDKFVKFWNRSTQYLGNFGVYKDADHKWSLKYNRFACYLYDAVRLYANALHELMEKPPSGAPRKYDPISDGLGITSKIRGSYESICGYTMTINENHDAKGNYTLLSWQSVEPRLNKHSADYYPLSSALDITAIFVEDVNGILQLKFHKEMQWLDGLPKDQPKCGFHGENCSALNWTVIGIVVLVGFCCICGVFFYVHNRHRRYEKELQSIWRIDAKEVHRITKKTASVLSLLADGKEFLDQSCFADPDKFMRDAAHYKGATVYVKELRFDKKIEFSREMKVEMRYMRQMAHPNINTFLGIITNHQSISVVREYCARGSLMDLLQNKDLKFDEVFIASFVDDLIRGMTYLHETGVHGNLKSTNCLISTRWVLQVADFGLCQMRDGREWDTGQQRWENLMWTAPEILRQSDYGQTTYTPSDKADVYSFGIILHEIAVRLGPFSIFANDSPGVEEIMRGVAENMIRPEIPSDVSIGRGVYETMKACWDEIPENRPDFRTGIRNGLRDHFLKQRKRNIMDHMMDLMENYQLTLEKKVFERTKQLHEEQQRSENLLQRMLPTAVAEQLLGGGSVVPELFPAVTIYFSDIVGFTRISGDSTPLQVVQFLNKLYTLFDDIIQQYDVYKIETIGDAYMVVSGVPRYTTKLFHAEQISMMALHLLAAVKNFTIPHLPKERLMLRIGMHTGSCVGGVVGNTMPRYCLFGDTVNTASRMESNGEPLKIHCSESTQRVLKEIPGFILEERGIMPIKGKGSMTTYWLNGRRGVDFPDIPDPEFIPELPLAPDLFPRQSCLRPVTSRGSSWGLNRESTLSLQKEVRRLERSVPRNTGFQDPTAAYFSCHNGGLVSVGSSYKELASVNEEEPQTTDRSRDRRRPFSRTHPRRISGEDEVVLRKRSTSLPDGEVLNTEQLVNLSNPAPLSQLTRRNTESHSLQSVSPSPSQYPSYRDINAEVQRKPGMALTVWPSRKRSLSVGDNLQMEAEAEVVDARQHLLETKRHRSRKPFHSRDRKSVLSLHGVLRDPSPFTRLRDASPFGRRSFWGSRASTERSRGESLNRLWRKIRNAGSEYTGLDDSTDGSDESDKAASANSQTMFSFGMDDCAAEPLIKAELMV